MTKQLSQPLEQLQLLLLDLLAPARTVVQAQIDALHAADWDTMLQMLHSHRVAPLLHWQLGRAHAHLTIPPEVKTTLAQSYKKATLRNLLLQRELLLLHQVLSKKNTPYVALKGSYLAYHAYPQPALRPMRDLDILVPKDQVLPAFQALLDAGLTRIDKYQGTLAAVILTSHHLPPIRSASGQVNVELHSRLFDHEKEGLAQADLSDTQEFWDRCVKHPVAGASLTFESPTDLLLHLIEHAVYHHQFDNGPLLLSDLAFLISTHTIDWPLFWNLAYKGRQTNGCWLTLRLTQRYWALDNIVWPEFEPPNTAMLETALDAAALLMLRDFNARSDIRLNSELQRATSWFAKMAFLLRKIFPTRAIIAANYPVEQDDWRIYFWYPVKWHLLLTNRLKAFMKLRRQQHLHPEIDQIATLNHWLSSAKM